VFYAELQSVWLSRFSLAPFVPVWLTTAPASRLYSRLSLSVITSPGGILMRKYFSIATFAFVICLLGATPMQAQSALLNLPRDSQHAKVIQRVGITDIPINYHRPLVKGRKVWGGIVPYGEVWRAGANENTTIEFSDPVTIEGQQLAKGIYGLHMIPKENEWVIIFSKNSTAWG